MWNPGPVHQELVRSAPSPERLLQGTSSPIQPRLAVTPMVRRRARAETDDPAPQQMSPDTEASIQESQPSPLAPPLPDTTAPQLDGEFNFTHFT